LPKTFFENIEVLCVDEAHTAKTKSIQTIFELANCNNIKFGLSGTVKTLTESADTFTIEGNLGPIVSNVSASSLFKKGYATPIKIRMLYLNYIDDNTREELYKRRRKVKSDKNKKNSDIPKLLQFEQEMIQSNKKRFDYIIDLILKPKLNSLVLFKDIKNNYGKQIYDTLKEKVNDNEEVYYIDGSVELKRRKYYRNQMNLNDNNRKIMVASFGTTSTGIDISNLHYIFLVESYKSEIIIKQSLGRGMRLNENKNVIHIIDIVDDFTYKGNHNYVYKQSLERKLIYQNESFQYKEYEVELK
jgi:superfamily II DNA or RNA helicase